MEYVEAEVLLMMLFLLLSGEDIFSENTMALN